MGKRNEGGAEEEEEGKITSLDIARSFRFGVFIILMLLLLVATFQFYFYAMEAISYLFVPEFMPLVQAGFAASVIAVVIYFLRLVIQKQK